MNMPPDQENQRNDVQQNTDKPGEFNLWKILGLSKSEIKILESIAINSNTAASISRRTRISDTTISYSLKKLKKRGLVLTSEYGKRFFWKSNISRIIREIQRLPSPPSKYPAGQKTLSTRFW